MVSYAPDPLEDLYIAVGGVVGYGVIICTGPGSAVSGSNESMTNADADFSARLVLVHRHTTSATMSARPRPPPTAPPMIAPRFGEEPPPPPFDSPEVVDGVLLVRVTVTVWPWESVWGGSVGDGDAVALPLSVDEGTSELDSVADVSETDGSLDVDEDVGDGDAELEEDEVGSREEVVEEVMGGSVTEVDDDVVDTEVEELTDVELVCGSFTKLQVSVPVETVMRGVWPKVCPAAFSTRSIVLVPAARSTSQVIAVAVAGAVPIS